MSLRILVAIAVTFVLPITACAKEATTAPVSNDGIIGFAYGHVFKGDPSFSVVNDTLYVSGTSQGDRLPYFPRREHVVVAPDNSNPQFNAVLDEARAAAHETSKNEGWSVGFIRVLRTHLGHEVTSYDPQADVIKVRFSDGNEVSVMVPCGTPETPKPFDLKTGIERQRTQFMDYVSRKVWVVWGSSYTILVPQQRHTDMLTAMEKVKSGLTITDVERQNTPFIEPAFERDFRSHMEEVR